MTAIRTEAATEMERPESATLDAQRQRMLRLVRSAAFSRDAEFDHYAASDTAASARSRTVDYIFATPDDPHLPGQVFERLRWGGQVVFASPVKRDVIALSRLYARKGFDLEIGPTYVRPRRLGLPLGRKVHFFVARKVLMVPPGEFSDRFTYHVHLQRSAADPQQHVVVKEVPDMASLRKRLELRFPEQEPAMIEKQARQLAQTIFPVFLTREAAFLKILQRDLPEPYRARVPHVVGLEKDERGYVRRLELNWMRKAVKPMSQLEFAIQSADLLMQLHEKARIIHLDLRLDNFVITDDGVGFVDYGSSARVGENIGASPFLNNLFTEIMRTSQIQRMLEKMATAGAVTSELITGSRQRVDKAVDLFYLAVQIEKPNVNPYIRELVNYDPSSVEAKLISQLCQRVLRPDDPKVPQFNSARDVLDGLLEISRKLGRQ